ncbi:MAG: DNA-directed RNA polymerase subunit beta' [Candidatus Caenarcaniphilales bacterium]|nr:DNA-directed RNA polymerase subunit beta' [Candidatus Caenarcaniphilales bacterium]
MNTMMNEYLNESTLEGFDLIQVKVASPDAVRAWSFGEVKKAETINYRTLAPEKEGLFCQKIFGPTKDWECGCGKYKRIRYRGIVCEVCGVEVTESRVRRYRMGHIGLASPVVHIWYLKGIPSYLSLLLEIPLRDLEQVVYFNSYIVIDPGNTDLKAGQLLSEDEYDELSLKEDLEFNALMGAEAILQLINNLTQVQYEFPDSPRHNRGKVVSMPGLEELLTKIKEETKLNKASAQKRVKLVKRLRLVDKLISSGIDPAWVVMDSLPVLPPDLRPMVQLDGGRFATSDLNDLYRRVINRNNRLIKLKEMYAPEIIVRNEKRMLQEAVDALIDNGRRGREVVGTNGRRLKSLSDIIEGKQGRFRQNLLGKRVDYSGRSVIVVGPNLKLNQCGVPAPILLELFKPFIIEKLIKKGLAPNIKTSKKMIENGLTVVWETLEEAIKEHPVLLNRAPTLHRLGIQAFEPVLVEGRAIQLHPLVCTSFNADFDGDQMAIHVPLSIEAQAEARLLMLASNNILLPATGQPSIVPSQDMVLGLYYLTIDRKDAADPVFCKGAGLKFASCEDACAAYDEGLLHLHSAIKVRVSKGQTIQTTVGRVIVNRAIRSVLGQIKKDPFPFVNEQLGKKQLSKLLIEIYDLYGTSPTAELANLLKDIGFHYATQAGVTIGIEDLDVPAVKKQLIGEAEERMVEAKDLFEKGLITEVERYNRVIDTWSETTEKLTEAVVNNFDRLNPVYMMAFSGARGNLSQVRQLVGMRGLMADSQGKIIDQPIKSNFREGLSVTEYIISSYGARKGIVDTALKTADSGYLTRRLVDVAQDVITNVKDCETERGIILRPIKERDKDVLPLKKRLFARTASDHILDPKTGEVLCSKGEFITRQMADKIVAAGIQEVKVRSALTCDSNRGVCVKCYGASLASNRPVAVGEAIGIIAAQSIGEPGTQLTMRTFHTGGAVAGSGSRKGVKASMDGRLKYEEQYTKETRTRYGEIVQQTLRELNLEVGSEKHKIPLGAFIKFRSGSEVKADQIIAEYTESTSKLLTEKAFKDILSSASGQVFFKDFQVDEREDRFGNISRTANQSGTIWVMEGQVYSLPAGSEIVVEDSQQIEAGRILSETNTYCEHSGVIRYAADIEVEKGDQSGKPYHKLLHGKELNVVIASITPQNASLEQTQQGAYIWRVNDDEKYILKLQPGEVIEDGMILAELAPSNPVKVTCSGEVRYAEGFELDEKRSLQVGQTGVIYFIPEEIHSISKDISLKHVENGERVNAGQEVVKDVITRIDGIVELKIENDIIYEVIIRPGELYEIDDPDDLKVDDGTIVEAGTTILPKVKVKEASLINLISDGETGQAKVFVRPVQTFEIKAPKLALKHKASSENIQIHPMTQVLYKDGDRVRNLEGSQLIRTSLVMKMEDDLKLLKGQIELEDHKLSIMIQDTILLRRESEFCTTYLMVDDDGQVKAGDVIAKTQVLTTAAGEIRLSPNDERKLLLITTDQLYTQELTPLDTLKEGDFVKKGDQLGQKADQIAECSGQLVALTKSSLIILKGRPYLISAGTQLQVESGSLVQRGDQLATLIFEQQKTGDIVQGLPRVEELLEARKPKDPGVLSPLDGKIRIEQGAAVGEFKLFVIGKEAELEVEIPPGQNLLVDDGQSVSFGEPLSDGVVNPHQVMELLGQEAVQLHLINEVQQVYCSQGVDIADKHIEVIVRQMTMKVKVEDPGDTTFLPGELVELAEVQAANEKALQNNEQEATYKHVLLGITKASLNTKSFISAASFQETTRILTESSLEGKSDELRGLKENVIVGKLIPAGTGYAFKLRRENSQGKLGSMPRFREADGIQTAEIESFTVSNLSSEN